MVLDFHGINQPERILRRMCKTKAFGTHPINVVYAVKEFGLEAYADVVALPQLAEFLNLRNSGLPLDAWLLLLKKHRGIRLGIDDLFLSHFFFIPLWLYAEIHYRFKFVPSRLFFRRPEIVADAPHRIAPGQPLPVLLLIKDANRFPIVLQQVDATINFAQQKFSLLQSGERIDAPLWWKIFYIDIPDDWRGRLAQVNVEIIYKSNGKEFRCANDNYIGASHAPLRVYFSNEALPTLPNFRHGELHCHTDATSDQVEFGAPVEAMTALATAQGLSFFSATDHSYDLDDLPENYLKNDPALAKWRALQERIKKQNEETKNFVIIPGEEVSAGNSRGRNVHFLIFNHPEFLPGSGDSGERWLRTAPELSIQEILAQIDDGALAFAAHPEVPAPKLEWLLLRRGRWEWPDYQHERLNGLQIWNGSLAGMNEGAARWRELLLAGKKIFIIAGNDAHGNFNRFRQVEIPHLKMREHHWHLFGRTRTAVLIEKPFSLSLLMSALRQGRACITTGPLLDLQIVCESGSRARLGETVSEAPRRLSMAAASSAEFGALTRVTIWLGNLQNQTEQILFETENFAAPFQFAHIQTLELPAEKFYLRGEARSAGSELLPEPALPCGALTNPIWIE